MAKLGTMNRGDRIGWVERREVTVVKSGRGERGQREKLVMGVQSVGKS